MVDTEGTAGMFLPVNQMVVSSAILIVPYLLLRTDMIRVRNAGSVPRGATNDLGVAKGGVDGK